MSAIRIFYGDQVTEVIDNTNEKDLHSSRYTEPSLSFIFEENKENIYLSKMYLITYSRIEGHQPYGEKLNTNESLSLIMEHDPEAYLELKNKGSEGIELVKEWYNN